MNVKVNWQGKRKFEAVGDSKHPVILDAKREAGGEDEGPRPMELLLMGLGGCTGIDVALILERMRLTIDEFHIEIDADRREEHPQKFTEIRMNYVLKGEELTPDKVERAIRLSEDKYCSASASLNAKIVTTYELNGEKHELPERADASEDSLS
jgi:putative redox protein